MSRVLPVLAAVLLLPLLQGCATTYQAESFTGGWMEKEVRPGVWSVGYAGNGFTSYETIQAYWLYHASELTLQKGYDGFEIVSEMELSSADATGFRKVQYYTNHEDKPSLFGTIRMLKKPVLARPPRIFDATALHAALEPRVKGKLCGSNVCPHVHDYLMPPLKS